MIEWGKQLFVYYLNTVKMVIGLDSFRVTQRERVKFAMNDFEYESSNHLTEGLVRAKTCNLILNCVPPNLKVRWYEYST
jgi:hypothetical protein